jgi:hypothetical protein
MKRVLCLYRPRGWKDEGSSRRAGLAGLKRVVSQFAGIRRCVLVAWGKLWRGHSCRHTQIARLRPQPTTALRPQECGRGSLKGHATNTQPATLP